MASAREVFVDAGAWIGITDAGDQYHRTATDTYRGLLRENRLLVTTNLVVAEAYILIRRAAGHPSAMSFLQALGQTTRLAKVYSDASLEEEAEEILGRYADQDFSFADAVTFVLMRRRGIAEAFAFDKHFAIAGFALLPPGA